MFKCTCPTSGFICLGPRDTSSPVCMVRVRTSETLVQVLLTPIECGLSGLVGMELCVVRLGAEDAVSPGCMAVLLGSDCVYGWLKEWSWWRYISNWRFWLRCTWYLVGFSNGVRTWNRRRNTSQIYGIQLHSAVSQSFLLNKNVLIIIAGE